MARKDSFGVPFTERDRAYVRRCIRYAVQVYGKTEVTKYLATLDDKGNAK